VIKWLKEENFTEAEIETIWRYLGGSPWEIQEVILQKKQGKHIEEVCQYFINDKY